MNEAKNKNLFIRVSEKEKTIIEQNAKRCGLSVSEYLRQRALGFIPRAALRYVSNGKKTDERMYVSGVNCNAKRAYERMTATKKRFGKTGGNVAYHGYQSFQAGEATPEEAHKIGLETARRMWGNEYEVVVTTHLNTDNVHNHFVVNSVSFQTGRKFENHISDHYRLREISDAVCLEHGKSILKDAEFYGGSRKEYWQKQNGGLSHRKILKADIDTALAQSANFKAFETRLKDMGYEICRGENFAHYSVKGTGWQRAVRLGTVPYSRFVLRS